MKMNKRDVTIIAIAAVAGLFLGRVFFHGPGRTSQVRDHEVSGHDHAEEATVWTCSMHPQIRMDKPGQCPICGMDLIPLDEAGNGEEAISPGEIRMTEAAMKIADVQTMTVRKQYPEKELFLLGKVQADERNIAELTARFGGRIERLYVNFTGQSVSKGEKLATLYSPSLVTAQRELLEAAENKNHHPGFYEAARSKLRLWDLTEEQIKSIEQNGEALYYFDVQSPISGTVTLRHVSHGDYIQEGDPLFRVIDLSHVWVMFEAYESDLPWISDGDRVSLTVRSFPGKTFRGRISFVDPVVDPVTRVAKVRVGLDNPGMQLKPGMFADGTVFSAAAGNRQQLLIPETAVLWTGKRAVVYVRKPARKQVFFSYREIVLGPESGDYYVVQEGLEEGEEIAVNGVFKIDAAAQLAGKPSMMNPEGGVTSTGHDHGKMETESSPQPQPLQGSTETSPATAGVVPVFRQQLTGVYDAYLEMKDAFVASDPEAVARESEKVDAALDRVDMNLLEGPAHMQWMDQLETLESSLEKITGSNEIETQRAAFAEFNLAFYKSVKNFGLQETTAYFQYCPMAIGDKGAYWLSGIREIRNPYFGDAMLSCGETREKLEY